MNTKKISDLIRINNAIMRNAYVLTAYYIYPTSSAGDVISQHERTVSDEYDVSDITTLLVERMLDEAVAKLGIRRDNKTAVEVKLAGIDSPLYFGQKDLRHYISTGVMAFDDEKVQRKEIYQKRGRMWSQK